MSLVLRIRYTSLYPASERTMNNNFFTALKLQLVSQMTPSVYLAGSS